MNTDLCFYRIIYAAAAAKSLQSCPTLSNPMDGSLPGSSIHGICQARALEWVAIAFSTNIHCRYLKMDGRRNQLMISNLKTLCFFIGCMNANYLDL